MKRFTLSLLVLIYILLFCIPAFGAVPLLGDMNDDGSLDLADALLTLKAVGRGDISGQARGLDKADFDVDGRIGLPEAVFILQAVAGLRNIAVPVTMRTGTVVLPAGWPAGFPLTSLKVFAELGSSAVGEDGGFSVPLSGSGDALTVVTSASGTALMIGYLTENPVQNVLGVESTAVALIFHGMGLYTQPHSSWAAIRGLITATPQSEALAGTITERLVLDTEAIVKGDAAITDALLAAVTGIAAPGPESLRRPASVGSRSVSRVPQSGDVTHVKIDGANPRSGVNIELDPAGNGITARNEFRRHVLVLVYRTGWEDKSGNHHATPWERVVDGPFAPVAEGAYLGATNAVGGVVSSLIDWATGNGAYTPSSWNPDQSIPLPMLPGIDPENIAKTFYRVVCVGDYLGYELLPGDLMQVAGEVKNAQETMQALEFFKEFLLPLIFAVIPGEKIATNLTLDKNAVEAAIDIVNFFCSMIPDVATNYAAGQYKNAAWAVVKAFASNGTLLQKTATLAVKWGIVKGLDAATRASIAGTAEKVFAVLSIADKSIAAFDVSVLMNHLTSSHPYEQWDATALWPTVRVQPKPATVESGKSVQLMATVGGETGSSDDYFYKFTWTTPGEHGKIVNPAGPAPPGLEIVMTSRSPGAQINYESAFDAESGDEDKVQVVIHRVGASGSAKLGNDETTVTVSGSHVELEPSTADVEPEDSQVFTSTVKPEPNESEGDIYYYQWENSALYGHLSGGRDAFESTMVKDVAYEAGDKEGVDSVSLTVYRERGGVRETAPLGIASAMVNVRKKHALHLTPQGAKLAFGGSQVYTATLAPEPKEGTELVYTWSSTATAGTLTGPGGTDLFEQSGNQATYRAGEAVGADAITVKVERISGGERFLLAEARVGAVVGDFTVTLASQYTVNQGKGIGIRADVMPYPWPTDSYFKWTRNGQKGQLQDYDTGNMDVFESALEGAYYRAHSDIPTGTDTVTVEMYVKRGGMPILLGSAGCKILVKGNPVLMNAVVRMMTAESPGGCGESYGYPNYRMYGVVALSWQPPTDFTPSSYNVAIDNHGHVVDPDEPYQGNTMPPFYNHTGGFTCNEIPCNESWCTVLVGTIPVGSVGYRIDWTTATFNESYYGGSVTKDEYFAYRIEDMKEVAAKTALWTINVWAMP